MSQSAPEKSILCIGVGNEHRRDDGIGLLLARIVRTRKLDGVTVLESNGDGAALMDMWAEAPTVILIDAVSSASPAGTLHRLEAHRETIPVSFSKHSTHLLSVAEAVEMARVLKRMPARLIIYGIEGADFGEGIGLSAEVATAAQTALERLVEEIRSLQSL